MHPCPGPVTTKTLALLYPLLQPTTMTRLALHKRCDPNILGRSVCRFHKTNICLHLNIIANVHFFCERRSPPANPPPCLPSESSKKILKVECAAEPSLGTTKPSKWIALSSKRIWACCTRVEACALI